MTLPPHYEGPHAHTRDPDQVMRDTKAQDLIAEICWLHEDLCAKLDHDVDLAALGAAEPASGYVTGSSDHDQMADRVAAIERAERERDRTRKNLHERLRRLVRDYEIDLGRRPPRRPRVESIDYRDGTAERRVG